MSSILFLFFFSFPPFYFYLLTILHFCLHYFFFGQTFERLLCIKPLTTDNKRKLRLRPECSCRPLVFPPQSRVRQTKFRHSSGHPDAFFSFRFHLLIGTHSRRPTQKSFRRPDEASASCAVRCQALMDAGKLCCRERFFFLFFFQRPLSAWSKENNLLIRNLFRLRTCTLRAAPPKMKEVLAEVAPRGDVRAVVVDSEPHSARSAWAICARYLYALVLNLVWLRHPCNSAFLIHLFTSGSQVCPSTPTDVDVCASLRKSNAHLRLSQYVQCACSETTCSEREFVTNSLTHAFRAL